jgi:hypothetical protein
VSRGALGRGVLLLLMLLCTLIVDRGRGCPLCAAMLAHAACCEAT